MEKGQLFSGGEIYTVDDSRPSAEAVAVRGGEIIAVGSASECRARMGKDHEEIALKGSCLLPGFIDTHLHPILMIYFDLNVDLRGTATLVQLQDKLREMARTGSPGQWVVGLHFDEQAMVEIRLPNRHDLDAAVPDRPVLVIKHDGHMAIANTRAIAAAGVAASTPDPEGGVIDRERDGFPAGPFRETAANILLGALPLPEIQAMIAGARASFQKLAACGITSVGAVLQTTAEGPAGASGAFDVLALVALQGQLPINCYGLLITRDLAKMEAARQTALHREGWPSRRLGGVKIYSDGAFGSCTAYMRDPFSDQPDKSGFLVQSPEEIYRIMTAAHRAGLQIAIHAIGDAANRVCIDLYDRLLREYPCRDHRHRIEHASLLDAAMVRDLARLGLVVSTQPLFIHSEKHWLEKRLGPERAKWTYPFKSLVDAGVRLAGASDAPVESLDVLHAIQCCVTREGFEPQQGLTPAQAVRMFTLDAAYAQFEDQLKGSIAVGKRADLVILSKNPVSVPADRIREIRVERTICNGQTIYNGGDQ